MSDSKEAAAQKNAATISLSLAIYLQELLGKAAYSAAQWSALAKVKIRQMQIYYLLPSLEDIRMYSPTPTAQL